MTEAVKTPTGWGEMPTRPGLYLSLSHGRDFPQQYVRSQGFAGPKIGPLLYVQSQYTLQLTLRFASLRDARRHFRHAESSTQTLHIVEETVVYGDKCYGTWDVCHIAAEFCLQPKIGSR